MIGSKDVTSFVEKLRAEDPRTQKTILNMLARSISTIDQQPGQPDDQPPWDEDPAVDKLDGILGRLPGLKKLNLAGWLIDQAREDLTADDDQGEGESAAVMAFLLGELMTLDDDSRADIIRWASDVAEDDLHEVQVDKAFFSLKGAALDEMDSDSPTALEAESALKTSGRHSGEV